MTIIEAINRIDAIKPNGYDQTQKIKWLSTLDGIVKKEVIDIHEGGEEVTFTGYTDETALTTKLLIDHPYDEVYIRYLETQIDYANGEYAKYNNSSDVFNEVYASFTRYYTRTHMPKGRKFKFF